MRTVAAAIAAVVILAGCSGGGTAATATSEAKATKSAMSDSELETLAAAASLLECGTSRTATAALCLGSAVADRCREHKEAGLYSGRIRRCARNAAIEAFQVLLADENRPRSYIADSVDTLVMPTADRKHGWHKHW